MDGHASSCDFSYTVLPPDPQCYCPTGAEEASRLACGHMPELACECAEYEEDW